MELVLAFGMRAALIRVGVDQAFGAWNAPVDPRTNEFVYVPIPDNVAFHAGLETPYSLITDALNGFAAGRSSDKAMALPSDLATRNMHLDPDFSTLTYGDNGVRRGKGIAEFEPGDLLVFYAGLRPCAPCEHRLLYALIGLFRVRDVARARDVPRQRWHENAHTRRLKLNGDDVIIRADPTRSGRLERCVPIGEWRAGAYRVRTELLDDWGGLSCRDGFIQRSAVPPMFKEPARFLRWFEDQGVRLQAENNPVSSSASSASAPVIVVMLRRPRDNDRRTDPLFEFGSFGLTGCHSSNLLADQGAAGARLAFVQGGHAGFRLVMLTPTVDVRAFANRREAFWSPAEMPLRYEAAPLLINNAGETDVPGMHDELDRVQRSTWEARFASAFRSRKSPLSDPLAAGLTSAWTAAVLSVGSRASAYWEALPRRPDIVDDDRAATFRRLRRHAAGER